MDTEADVTETVLDAEQLHALDSATISDSAEARREALQRTLAEHRGSNDIRELSVNDTQKELYALAQICRSGNFSTFKRFETLIMFDLLQYQHELVELDNKIRFSQGVVTLEVRAKLRNSIREYQEAIQRWRSTQELTALSKEKSATWFVDIAKTLREPNYINHEEALEGIDISIEDMGMDSIKTLLQSFLPARFAVPEIQRDRQAEVKRKLSFFNLSGKYEEHINALKMRPEKVRLTPIVTRLATFFIALVGGISLVVPMFALIYISSMVMKIIVVSVSVLTFAALLAGFTMAKNQEVLAATAAYAAVLVVFVSSPGIYTPSS